MQPSDWKSFLDEYGLPTNKRLHLLRLKLIKNKLRFRKNHICGDFCKYENVYNYSKGIIWK
ncbi:hypothetical protein DLK05_13340 [Ancylomarina longa]|uniref:Uncharacterized protein n=1 Tax=Ancylomarina longa TaxID=2487017 RepID=A0A434AGD0_9BACT|nr:hypothetical protein DLK05_13340 [Ancylomarina longa]